MKRREGERGREKENEKVRRRFERFIDIVEDREGKRERDRDREMERERERERIK